MSKISFVLDVFIISIVCPILILEWKGLRINEPTHRFAFINKLCQTCLIVKDSLTTGNCYDGSSYVPYHNVCVVQKALAHYNIENFIEAKLPFRCIY